MLIHAQRESVLNRRRVRAGIPLHELAAVRRIHESTALSDAPFDPTAPAPAEPRTLRSGDAGEDVEELQLDLRRLGYAVLVTGTFGPITERLVCDFQRDHGLTTDGIYGPATRQALAAALAGKEGSPHA